jgi:hypothetical protein
MSTWHRNSQVKQRHLLHLSLRHQRINQIKPDQTRSLKQYKLFGGAAFVLRLRLRQRLSLGFACEELLLPG